LSDPITSDIPLPPPKEETTSRKSLLASLKRSEERQFYVEYCPSCGELTTNNPLGFSCKNKCISYDKPLKLLYNPKLGDYKTHFCITTEEEKCVFKPMLVAKWVKQNYIFKTDRTTDTLYRYDDEKHKWSIDGEVFLREVLGKQLALEYKVSSYTNILDSLKAITYEDIVFGKKISCLNGLLDLDTGELAPFSPNEMPFHFLPIKYDKEAKCEKWTNFIDQVVSPDDKDLMQEWSGYLLEPGYQKHKILFAYGVGRNGKGVWSRTMRGILGKDNCVSMRLEEFNGDRRFSIQRLFGKLYCECSEPLTNKTLQTPIIKALTGADNQDAEVKGIQQTIGFTNHAKITIYGNKYPKVNDNTEGFYDRIEILEFPNQFKGEKQTDDLEKQWLEDEKEKSGILNWMLEGRKRLFEKGKFTTSKSQQQKIIELKRLSDPTGAFADEKLVFTPLTFTPRTVLYNGYVEYCEEIGAVPDKENSFTQKLKTNPKVKAGFKRIEGVFTRVWLGVSSKKIQDFEGSDVKQTVFDTLDTSDTPLTLPRKTLLEVKNIGECTGGVSYVSSVSDDLEKEVSNPVIGETGSIRVCGSCIKFGRGECEYPRGPDAVCEDFSWAYNCRGFQSKVDGDLK
jgi:P4 family phage/plasmid primase-like protien